MVVVSVKVPHHYDLIKPALEAGKDVFVEWPLAANLAQAEELTQLAKEQGCEDRCGAASKAEPEYSVSERNHREGWYWDGAEHNDDREWDGLWRCYHAGQ